MKSQMIKLRMEGAGTVPRFYGYSYSPFNAFVDVYYIFPINLIVAFARRLWFRIVHAKPDNSVIRFRCLVTRQQHRFWKNGFSIGYQQGKSAGYNEAYKQGYSAGWHSYQKELKEAVMGLKEDVKTLREGINDDETHLL